jgi:hypothetical protein
MHWDGTVSLGSILTICTTLFGLILGGVRIAFHLQKSSDAMNNLASITERLQKAVEKQDGRLYSLEAAHAVAVAIDKYVAEH